MGIALLCGSQVLAQTNQQLLQDGLISPLVFELLERRGAKTPEQRFAVIRRSLQRASAARDRLWDFAAPKERLITQWPERVWAMGKPHHRGGALRTLRR